MATWNVISDGKGFSVRKDKEGQSVECTEMGDAIRHIKTRFSAGDKVVLVEPDGYKTVITRQVARKGWRR